MSCGWAIMKPSNIHELKSKLLVSTLITPIIVPYIVPFAIPF